VTTHLILTPKVNVSVLAKYNIPELMTLTKQDLLATHISRFKISRFNS